MQLSAELPQSKRHCLVQEGSALLPSENLRSDIRLNTLRDTDTSDSVIHEVDTYGLAHTELDHVPKIMGGHNGPTACVRRRVYPRQEGELS